MINTEYPNQFLLEENFCDDYKPETEISDYPLMKLFSNNPELFVFVPGVRWKVVVHYLRPENDRGRYVLCKGKGKCPLCEISGMKKYIRYLHPCYSVSLGKIVILPVSDNTNGKSILSPLVAILQDGKMKMVEILRESNTEFHVETSKINKRLKSDIKEKFKKFRKDLKLGKVDLMTLYSEYKISEVLENPDYLRHLIAKGLVNDKNNFVSIDATNSDDEDEDETVEEKDNDPDEEDPDDEDDDDDDD